MPFRAFVDTMTKWSGAAPFIFQLWPEASDTPADGGKWKEVSAVKSTALYLQGDSASPPAVWALAFSTQTIWLKNVGQARKEACTPEQHLEGPESCPAEDLEVVASSTAVHLQDDQL